MKNAIENMIGNIKSNIRSLDNRQKELEKKYEEDVLNVIMSYTDGKFNDKPIKKLQKKFEKDVLQVVTLKGTLVKELESLNKALGKSTKFEVLCGGKRKTFKNREQATKFFEYASISSEGAEHERYSKILIGIKCGDELPTDGVPERKVK